MNPASVVPQRELPSPPGAARAPADVRIGQILFTRQLMSAAQIARVLEEQAASRLRFGEVAVRLGFVASRDVEDVLALQFGYTAIEPSTTQLPGKLFAAFQPASPFAESLRGLRSHLMMRWFDGTPGQSALAITSVDRGDGKSFIAANLGVVFAQLGESTLIIDADLRHPTQHAIFGVHNRMGLSGLLSRRAGLEEIAAVPAIENLSVLPSGPLPPNPQELLGRPEFSRLLNELSGLYDVVLIDTPSAQQSSDSHVIALRAGAALLVGRKNRTKSTEIAQLASIMANSGIQILGSTLNEA